MPRTRVINSVSREEEPMPQPNDVLRQGLVLVSALLAVAGAFIGSGAAGGIPISDAAGGALAADATAIAPGGPAFIIWTPIYLGLLAYALWQSLPAHRTDDRQRRLGYPIAASLLLNAAWILSIQFDALVLSIPIIAVLLIVLAVVFGTIIQTRASGPVEVLLVDGTIGLYLGWVCVATAANIAAGLNAAGFRGAEISSDIWAVAVVAFAGIIGVLLAVWGRGRFSPSAALCWGLGWIAVARLTGDLISTPTAVAAIVAIVVVVGATLVLRIRLPRLVAA